MRTGADGWISGVRKVASANCDSRPRGSATELLVIHNISLPPGEFGGDAIERLFTNALPVEEHPYYARLNGLKVSAHFLIRRNGEIVQFVSCNMRAWHAGVSSWCGRSRCNDFSIGVELEGSDETPFDERQYDSLTRLTRVLKRSYPLRGVAGHSDISPERKTDPGPCFDWARYLSSIRNSLPHNVAL